MAQYRKIDVRIWNDKKFRSMSDNGKFLFIFLLTHPNLTCLGAMKAINLALGIEIGWQKKRFTLAFNEIVDLKMAVYDSNNHLLWLPNFIKYNKPESPNVVKAWLKTFDLLPECDLRDKIIKSLKAFVEGLSEAFQQAFEEGHNPTPINQEQEQKQEQKQDAPLHINEIVDLYHSLLPELPRVRVVTNLVTPLKARLKEDKDRNHLDW